MGTSVLRSERRFSQPDGRRDVRRPTIVVDADSRICAVLRRVWRAYRQIKAEYGAQQRAWATERAALVARAEQAEKVVQNLKVEVGQHARNRFGRRSERQSSKACGGQEGKKRGQRRGKKGHGRRRDRYLGLPEIHVTHDVPQEDKYCHNCGTPRVEIKEGTSEELHVELLASRRVHHRKCYVANCSCQGTKRIVRGEPPVKLIPRASLSVGTIAFVATARYMWGLPLHRITTILRQCGARVPDGTLVGAFEAIQPLLQPLYDAICTRNRQSKYLHADETTWRQLWVAKGKRGYIWCFVGSDTTVYLFDPGRDHTVVLKSLGLEGTAWGGQVVDLMCDFMAAYDKAMRIANATERRLNLSRCWSHYRRLFLDIPAHHPEDRRLAAEVEQWLGMITDLFRLHRERDMAGDGSEEQEAAQAAFRGCLQEMEGVRAQHLRRRKLAPELRHVLEFGAQHWEELTRCAEDVHHPIDNNIDERRIRLPVIIRKNAYGSGAPWAAEQACQFWTIGQTALQNEGNPLALINAYFEACAQAGGKVPEDWHRFLPWVREPQPPDDGARVAAVPAADLPAAGTASLGDGGPAQAAHLAPAPANSGTSVGKPDVVAAPATPRPGGQRQNVMGAGAAGDRQVPVLPDQAAPANIAPAEPVRLAVRPRSVQPDGPLAPLAPGIPSPSDHAPGKGLPPPPAARALTPARHPPGAPPPAPLDPPALRAHLTQAPDDRHRRCRALRAALCRPP